MASAVIRPAGNARNPLDSGRNRVAKLLEPFTREADDEHAVGSRKPHAHDCTGERWTESVVSVANSVHTMPASGPQRRDDHKGIGPRLEMTTIRR